MDQRPGQTGETGTEKLERSCLTKLDKFRVRKQWDPDELIEAWTLVDANWKLAGNKTGATRLGFGLILKFMGSRAGSLCMPMGLDTSVRRRSL
jgi:hypothetical protein